MRVAGVDESSPAGREIYIPEEAIGVRIEDMVLVTETGAKIMSSALPREPAEIERVLGRK